MRNHSSQKLGTPSKGPPQAAPTHGAVGNDIPGGGKNRDPNISTIDDTASHEWYYSSAMKIFHLKNSGPASLTNVGFVPIPPGDPIAGFVCQAARALLNVSQAWLWERAGVSKKTINDFENGFLLPKPALNLRLRNALEEAGAHFVSGPDIVGVVVYSSRNEATVRSKSEKRRAP